MRITFPSLSPWIPLAASIILIGIGGMVGQLLLIRVLMVIFLGNELSMSLVIASWLLFEGLGSFLGGKISHRKSNSVHKIFLIIFTIYPLLLAGAVFLARFMGHGLPGLIPGEAMTLGQMLLTSILTVGVTGIFHGSLFPLGAQMLQQSALELPVSRAYITEIVGTILGGLIFVFLLAPRLNAMEISLGLIIFHIPVTLLLLSMSAGSGSDEKYESKLKRKAVPVIILFLLAMILFFPSLSSYLHEASLAGLWPEGDIVGYHNSPYGNIVTLEQQNEISIIYDGRPIISLPHPDTASLKDYAYLAGTAHPEPDEVLVLGAGLGGLLNYFLDHPVENLTYAELDPKLLQVAENIEADIIDREFGDERTQIKNEDGRLYLNRTERKFDLIVLGQMDTDTLQTNRFFTEEFFQIIDQRLHEGGVLAFTLEGSLTYLGDEMGLLNSSLYETAGEVFSEVKLIPGDQNIMLASHEKIELSPEAFSERLEERGIYGGMFTRGYLDFRLDPHRIEEFNLRLEEFGATINRDFAPAGFLYGLLNWGSAFAPEALRIIYGLAARMNYILPAAAVLAGLLIWRLLFMSGAKTANRYTYAIATSGGAAMSFDLFTLFAFQSLFGHIYQLNGLFIAAFMGGMFFGGRLSHRKLVKKTSGLKFIFLRLEMGVIAMLLMFPLVVNLLRELMLLPAAAVLGAILCVIFALFSGGIVGAQFPLATNLLPDRFKKEAGTAAGRLYTADLIGGWLAGMLVGIVLFPLMGLTTTLVLLALFKASSLYLIRSL